MKGIDLQAVANFVDGEFPAQVSAWLATYLVHGVCLFVLAALAARVIKSARGVEQLWRAALFGPLVTASLQLGAGFSPAFGHWELPGSETQTSTVRAVTPLEVQEALILARLEKLTGDLSRLTVVEEAAAPTAPAEVPAIGFAPKQWRGTIGLLVLAAGIAMLMLRALLEAIRMHALGRRSRLMSGPVVRAVSNLKERAGIRRTIRVEVTELGNSPYATGVLLPSIVLPERALTELDGPSLHAMLAHEMGHIARLDPLWTAAARSVAALFFFQPLNWLMLRRLDESAEYCCDEFAVDVTGNEVALARCLTTVAEWIVGVPRAASPACPMAHQHSPLSSRVHRILATDGLPTRPLGALRWAGGAIVLATAMAAPGFAARQTQPTAIEAAPLVPVAPSAQASPFAALGHSIDQMQEEIRTLIALAGQRQVPDATVNRLKMLGMRGKRVRAYLHQLEDEMRRLDR